LPNDSVNKPQWLTDPSYYPQNPVYNKTDCPAKTFRFFFSNKRFQAIDLKKGPNTPHPVHKQWCHFLSELIRTENLIRALTNRTKAPN